MAHTQESAAESPATGPATSNDEPCFTEAELSALLPPIPQWMRKGPRPKSQQRRLFDQQ